jgi:hypothetical protein
LPTNRITNTSALALIKKARAELTQDPSVEGITKEKTIWQRLFSWLTSSILIKSNKTSSQHNRGTWNICDLFSWLWKKTSE